MTILDELKFDKNDLIPVVIQDNNTKDVLMVAWMNKESINLTISNGYMYYWSRSRSKIWKKGETSNQTQKLVELRIDCDKDSLLALVEQNGVACHTGTKSCFFETIQNNKFVRNQDIITSPETLYNK